MTTNTNTLKLLIADAGGNVICEMANPFTCELDELRAQRDELLKACELFTKAAQDAVRDLNNNGLACPASIAYAAEAARHAIAKAQQS